MGIFDGILGGVLKGLDVQRVIKRVLTSTTASAVKPVLIEFFNTHMNAAGRIALAKLARLFADKLEAGHVAEASDALAQIIHDIKL